MQPEEFLTGTQHGLEVYRRVLEILGRLGPFETRVSKSQIGFRRRRGFAYIWRPNQYLSSKSAEVALSIALGHHDPSARFKEVAHPSARQWMHHLEIQSVSDIDDEVGRWLSEAYQRAK